MQFVQAGVVNFASPSSLNFFLFPRRSFQAQSLLGIMARSRERLHAAPEKVSAYFVKMMPDTLHYRAANDVALFSIQPENCWCFQPQLGINSSSAISVLGLGFCRRRISYDPSFLRTPRVIVFLSQS